MSVQFLTQGLTAILEKDKYTYEHSLRVGQIAKGIATYLKYDDDLKQTFVIGCCLHDVGKLFIPDEILQKESTLEQGDYKLMQKHTSLGEEIALLKGVTDKNIINIIKYHHERWDGSGYHGLKGEDIPVYARICAIIDSFDCMTHERSYKKAMSVQNAKDELIKFSSKQFHSYDVHQFLEFTNDYPKFI